MWHGWAEQRFTQAMSPKDQWCSRHVKGKIEVGSKQDCAGAEEDQARSKDGLGGICNGGISDSTTSAAIGNTSKREE